MLASVACIAALAVPVAVALSPSGPTAKPATTASPHLTRGVAERQVISALSATTSSGSFNVSYEFDPPTPPTVTTTTTTEVPTCTVIALSPGEGVMSGAAGSTPPTSPQTSEVCTGSGVSGPSPSDSSVTTGHGTIDTDPFAMVAVSNVAGLGQITLRDNGTDVWEFGGADYGLAPGSSETGPGASLSGFASLVEGTLGARQGALAMGGLSSPTGYLDLDQSMITGADQTGTGTVDGVPVTVYTISIDPGQGANIPGLNAEQAKAIADSDAILKQQDFTGSTVQVSIDASGYIRQTRSVAHFSDGSTTSSESTFSDFGCAGTVLMPGQTGTYCAAGGVRVARHRRRPLGNDHIDGPVIHHCAVDDTAADIHDRYRAAEVDYVNDRHDPIDHDDHRPGSDDDIRLSVGLARMISHRRSEGASERCRCCPKGQSHPRSTCLVRRLMTGSVPSWTRRGKDHS